MRRFSEPVASTTLRHGNRHFSCSAGHVPDATRNGARINTRSSSVSCPLRNRRFNAHSTLPVFPAPMLAHMLQRWCRNMNEVMSFWYSRL
ncbi:hypothetical protein [Escherichia phage phiWAO78-1]|nr:hypothetical protein [Escherichia phage phiWAO78-1]